MRLEPRVLQGQSRPENDCLGIPDPLPGRGMATSPLQLVAQGFLCAFDQYTTPDFGQVRRPHGLLAHARRPGLTPPHGGERACGSAWGEGDSLHLMKMQHVF